ncbi:PREDICTED: uncharacterized protein DDB_G0286299-like isoform X2 [Wasmannia auropunctata]|uniref:uncharacterized protein DDB_G0286299-like isoform X2 n=1 Tax=Wasmannia auropunctata TaxID=64793 RepID=UPI0005EEB062|nr:PREDICTED: uncharacterized protein DDB_G0286299-like isoform X2 [Wasmannia auropunctata]
MSRNTKNRNGNIRRSALSFAGGDGSLDVDHVLESDPWKDIEKFETSEVARIQNVLKDFGDMIAQEKTLKVKDHTTAKNKASPRSAKKSPLKDSTMNLPGTSSSTNSENVVETQATVSEKKRAPRKPRQTRKKDKKMMPQELLPDIDNAKEESQKSPLKDSTMNLPGTSSSTNSENIVETTVNKKKRAPRKPRQTSKKVEEMIPSLQELSLDIDNAEEEIQKFSNNSAKKNVNSINKILEYRSLQDITNINETGLVQTSTPKREIPIKKTIKKTAKREELTAENKRSKTKNSENKSEKNVQHKKQKLKRNTKDKEGSANILGEQEKTNVKSENNLKCNKVNQNLSKNKVEDKKVENCSTFLSEIEKKCEEVEVNNNIKKINKSKEYNKSMPNQLKKKKLKEENSEKKVKKSDQSRKSLKRISNTEKTKCQHGKCCAKKSDNQCSRGKKQVENEKQYKKNIKAARAIEDLSRRITVVKKKMDCIKNDLESNELLNSSFDEESSYSSQSSYSTYSSSSSDSRSYTSCSCSNCSCDESDCTSSDFSSGSESESTSEGEDSR